MGPRTGTRARFFPLQAKGFWFFRLGSLFSAQEARLRPIAVAHAKDAATSSGAQLELMASPDWARARGARLSTARAIPIRVMWLSLAVPEGASQQKPCRRPGCGPKPVRLPA